MDLASLPPQEIPQSRAELETYNIIHVYHHF